MKTILVADDSDDLRRLYAGHLQTAGFTVLEARNGLEAIHLATARLPALIVMDLSMPCVDGWEATRRLKRDARTRHLPILAFTALADRYSHARALEAGCCSVCLKPCDPAELVWVVRAHLGPAARV